MDNGTQFTGKKLRKFCEDSGIKLKLHPDVLPVGERVSRGDKQNDRFDLKKEGG